MALLGVAHLGAGATGATIEIIRQIDLPDDVGEINAEGFSGFIAQNILQGTINAEGFAPNVAKDASVTGIFGSLNAEGFVAMVGISQVSFSPAVGVIRAEGSAPTIDADFRVILPQVGIAHARTADGASLKIFNFIEPPDPWYGEVNAVGSIATIGEAASTVGIIRAEGFAPNVTSADVIFAASGEIHTHFAGTTAAIIKIRVIDGPTTGEKHSVGFQPSATILREGGIWFAPSIGRANAEGFAPEIRVERTVTGASVRWSMNLEGRIASVSRPNVVAFEPSVGVVNAEGIAGIVTTGRWTPTGPGSQIWTPVDEESQTWTSVSEDSSTWTPVDEAV